MPVSPKEVTIHQLKRKLLRKYGEHLDMSDVGGTDKETTKVSRALAAFAINYFNSEIDEATCAFNVCDGSDDHCIDAIYVNHDKKLVTITQSKFDQSGTGSISRKEFNDYMMSCKDIILENYNLFNKKFQRSLSDLETAYDNSYDFVFSYIYSGTTEITDEVKHIIASYNAEFNADLMYGRTEAPYKIEIIPLEYIMTALSKATLRAIDINDVELLQYGATEHPLSAVHGIITGDQIAQWWNSYGDMLFEKNIRGGLGENTDVNIGIKNTLLQSPEMFWYYNNGITVLVDDYDSSLRNAATRRESGRFNFKNASIINGAQTVTTIGKTFSSNEINIEKLETVRVGIRFIKVSKHSDEAGNAELSDYGDVALNVTIANNSQNKVTGRDFASKDPIQIKIRDSVALEENYIYEIKRNDDNTAESPYTITMDEALSALVCSSTLPRNIATLKSNRGRFFESTTNSFYKSVFNPSVTSINLINSVNFLRACVSCLKEMELKCTNSKSRRILIHGRYVFIARAFNDVKIIKNASRVLSSSEIPSPNNSISASFDKIQDYITTNYPNGQMPRFFENLSKVNSALEL